NYGSTRSNRSLARRPKLFRVAFLPHRFASAVTSHSNYGCSRLGNATARRKSVMGNERQIATWVKRIKEADGEFDALRKKSVSAIVKVGELLNKAFDDLKEQEHGQWGQLVKTIGWDEDKVLRRRTIARHSVLKDPANWRY